MGESLFVVANSDSKRNVRKKLEICRFEDLGLDKYFEVHLSHISANINNI